MHARRQGVLLRLAVFIAVAATSMGLAQDTTQADPNPIEDSFPNPGPWAVTWSENVPGGTTDSCQNGSGDPVGPYTYVYPTALGAFEVDHPVIVWGNGTSVTGDDGTCSYEAWLRYLASWGYVVVAPNSSSVGDGAQLAWGGAVTARRNDIAGDPFYQKLDPTSVGVAGHSQGALGAINATLDHPGLFASVTSYSLPSRGWLSLVGFGSLMPTKAEMDGLNVRIFFLWGTADIFQGGGTTTISDWAPPTDPFAAGAIVGADHSDPFTGGAGYSIAWNHYTLLCHAPAIPAFVTTNGVRPEILTNSAWTNKQVRGLTASC